jgi:TPR repeat protein
MSEDHCCWPEQRWESGLCKGLPRCPAGRIAHDFECVTRAAYASVLSKDCGALEIGFESAPSTKNQARRACDELAFLLADADADWVKGCEGGEVAACTLLGGSRQGYRTASARIELYSPRCAKGSDCHGHAKKGERLGFAGPTHDDGAARAAFEKACRGGAIAACIELAQQAGTDTSAFRELCTKHGEPAACSEAAYQIAVVGRVTDAALIAKAGSVLASRCDSGVGLACNNLAFLIERKIVEPKSDEASSLRYQAGCRLGNALACTNLVALALRSPKIARTITWDDGSKILEAACNENTDDGRRHCLAFGFVLQRGYGRKPDLRRGTELVKRLCKAGFQEACQR